MRRRRFVAVAAGLAAAAWFAWLRMPTETSRPVRSSPAAVVAPDPVAPMRSDPAPARAAPDAGVDIEAALARTSLRGTQRDGGYTLGVDGRLVLDAGLVRAFDYWLSLSGEVPDAQVRALLLADVRAAHGEAVAEQAAAAFDRYAGLRAHLASTPLADDLATRFAQIRDARRTWFGAEAEAMFGEEEAQVAYTLQRERLETADLAPAERAARLAALDATRPPAARTAQRDATAAVTAEQQTRQLDALGAGAPERRAEREALWGADAAARLARLDAQRADWDRRVAAYLRDRATLDAPAAAALRAARFTPEERARVEALEAIGQLRVPDG